MRNRAGPAIKVHFVAPPAPLRPYVTALYRTEVTCPPGAAWVEDWLHPEWANLRFLGAAHAEAGFGTGVMEPSPAFAVTGPTSRAIRVRLGPGQNWGIGLLPLGWARLIGAPADAYADRIVDAKADPVFAPWLPLAAALAASDGEPEREAALISAHLARLLAEAAPIDPAQETAIGALNAALVDPEVASVADLALRLGMTVRSLERLSYRAFGFAPKLLIRRQRFLRSLARVMLDPALTWLGALDSRYHDQPHFVRDFRRFMGMSPSAYARADKPLLRAAAQARVAALGEAVQALHAPGGAEPG